MCLCEQCCVQTTHMWDLVRERKGEREGGGERKGREREREREGGGNKKDREGREGE